MTDLLDLFSFIDEGAAATASSSGLGTLEEAVSESPFVLEREPSSVLSSVLLTEFTELRDRVSALECQLQVQTCLRDVIDETERVFHENTIKEKVAAKERMHGELEKSMQKTVSEKAKMAKRMEEMSRELTAVQMHRDELSAFKRALAQDIGRIEHEYGELARVRQQYSDYRDVSQLSGNCVSRIISFLGDARYTQPSATGSWLQPMGSSIAQDFARCLTCSKAWRCQLERPHYFYKVLKEKAKRELVLRQLIERPPDSALIVDSSFASLDGDGVDASTGLPLKRRVRLKQVKRCVIQLTLASGRQSGGRRPAGGGQPADEIYQQCMQQLQRVIAAAELGKDELKERVKASNGILKFMRASMNDKMAELSQLRVRKWHVAHILDAELSEEKRELHQKRVQLEKQLTAAKRRVAQMQVAFRKAHAKGEEKLKVTRDLLDVSQDTAEAPLKCQMDRVKKDKKKLVKVLRQLRAGISQRDSEVSKYETRVQQLEQVYHKLP